MTTQSSGFITRPTSTLELNLGYFRQVAADYGWMVSDRLDFDRIAAELGISESQARRILTAEQRPGTTFIGGLMVATDDNLRFRKTFRVVDASQPIGKE
ncbi:MAG TPA: hypothetical protein VGL02_01340 [Streptomyces sp.]